METKNHLKALPSELLESRQSRLCSIFESPAASLDLIRPLVSHLESGDSLFVGSTTTCSAPH